MICGTKDELFRYVESPVETRTEISKRSSREWVEAGIILIKMDRRIKNKIAMYETVRAVVQSNQGSWSSVPGFVTMFSEYTAKLQVLRQANYEQGIVLLGVSVTKEQLRNETIDKAVVIVGALKAMALSQNDESLLEVVSIAKGDLQSASGLMFIHLIDRILAKANEHLTEIAAFGIDQAMVVELQDLRDNCELLFGAPRQAIIDRKSFTETIRNQVKALDRLLKLGLDTLMLAFRESAPDFYFHYKAARIIVDTKGKGASPGSADETEDPL